MTKQVSGTIMLHLEDGSKRFLVHEIGKDKEFARTDTKAENTVLASFLNFLKATLHINVNDIRLVELTNTQSHGDNLPLYVFEMSLKWLVKWLVKWLQSCLMDLLGKAQKA